MVNYMFLYMNYIQVTTCMVKLYGDREKIYTCFSKSWGWVFETSLSFSIGLHFNEIYFQPIPNEIISNTFSNISPGNKVESLI